MQNLYFGLGDNPASITGVWYEECQDGHPVVLYVGGVAYVDARMDGNRAPFHRVGGCPACAGALLARYDRQEAEGEAP